MSAWNKLPPDEKRRRNIERCRAYYNSHRIERAIKAKDYRNKNQAKLVEKRREYYQKNKESISARNAIYVKNNPQKVNAVKARHRAKRLAGDPNFRLLLNIRERIRFSVKKNCGIKARTMDMIGCSLEMLRGYLEAQFKPGMTWENMGEWHIDHVIPCEAFDLSAASSQKQCFNYTNLQPLWRMDNFKKSDILPSGQRARHMKHKLLNKETKI